MKTRNPITASRREFGGAAIVGAASLAVDPLAGKSAAAEDSPGWIDAHVHVWTPDTKNYPLSPEFKKSEMIPPSFTVKELFDHCKPAGVQRIVLIQMSFYQFDHRYMIEAMESNTGVFSGVALIDHRASDVADRMDRLAKRGMRGFRLHSHGDAKDWVDHEAMGKLWRHAGEQGLAVCPLINPEDIPHVDALCQKFPDTTVVVDHFARLGVSGSIVREQLDMLCRLARFPKVHVKTSAFYALGKKTPPYEDLIPMIRRMVDAYGPERLMWASDCPFQVQDGHSYEDSIALIRDRIDFLSASDKRWMLRGTAERVFFA